MVRFTWLGTGMGEFCASGLALLLILFGDRVTTHSDYIEEVALSKSRSF